MATTLYASVDDLRGILQGTDDGSGTAAKLTDAQLTFALRTASNQVSIYFGSIMDSSVPQAVPPDSFHDVTLDLAAFYATKMYLKNKSIGADHPVRIAYETTIQLLKDVRDGKVRLDPVPAGGIGSEVGVVINRIPPIFHGGDSNTRIDPTTGYLESDTPYYEWTARTGGILDGGPVYQGLCVKLS